MIDSKNQIAILAGGQGSRLKSRTGNLPKPMAPLCGIPVLEHQIMLCRKHGFTKIALFVHYEYEQIKSYFLNGEKWGVDLIYKVELTPRGTAGALSDGLELMEEDFIVLYGDTYLDVDLEKLLAHHQALNGDATLLIHPNDHPHDSDLVEVNSEGLINKIHPYPHEPGKILRNLVNAALYVIKRSSFIGIAPLNGKSDLAKDCFPLMISLGKRVAGCISPEYIKDMGTPERIDKVERDILFGLPDKLSSRNLRQAVFMDRDGTINKEVNHLKSVDQLEVYEGVPAAIRVLNKFGALAICITNQPVVARGELSYEGLNAIHGKLDQILGAEGAYLDRYYICPHHPHKGFAGEVSELKIACNCRKPKTGMIDQAVDDLFVSRRKSWMIGDSTTDIRCGKLSGLRTILVRTGYAGADKKFPLERPDFIFPNLASSIDWIINGYSAVARKIVPIVSENINARLVLVGGISRSGKTSIAQVLSDQFELVGRRSHIISLDGWLKVVSERSEGLGIEVRYDLKAFKDKLGDVLKGHSKLLSINEYDRLTREVILGGNIFIGRDDVLIVEGVPAILDSELRAVADLSIHVDISDDCRKRRMQEDYEWRGLSPGQIEEIILSRDIDEVPKIRAASQYAHYQIDMGLL